MDWLVIVVALAALAAIHELVVFGLARVLGGQPRRRGVIVWLDGRRRAAVAFAGAIAATYVVVIALAFGFYTIYGVPTGRAWYSVGEVKAGFDAMGKLERGDRIVATNGVDLDVNDSLVGRVNAGGGKTVTLTIVRADRPLDVTVQPKRFEDHWLLGIVPRREREADASAGAALAAAVRYPSAQAASFAREVRSSIPEERLDPGGPKRMYDEFELASGSTYRLSWMFGLRLAVAVALVLAGLDLVRAIRLVVARRA
jgi:membrane-associated protease RseP (regulator of RpoE activity)